MFSARLFAVLFALLVPRAASTQTPQWILNPNNGRLYAEWPATTWAQAQQAAAANGANLATVRNLAEHDWLVQTFGATSPFDTRIWIGFTDQGSEGNWYWISGEPVTFFHWGAFEPDNNNGTQHFGALWLTPTSIGLGWRWCDDYANASYRAIFEKTVQSASFSGFGSGCAGASGVTPQLNGVATEPPRLGATARIQVTNLPVGTVTVPVFVTGLSNQVDPGPPAYSLPIDLSPLGWIGCQQLVSREAIQFAITTSGTADYLLAVPSLATLQGFTFHVQAVVLYSSNIVAVTNGVTGVVGS